ncbi:116_t:CDS:2 [Racocetra fulgida]|uniref:116_t:CDS:1 n=1 Tax=Racocetra fulgida TaxID=60492 RepID=A0A9N8WEW1_9GLOM|nr:116_t:CDS:2 [Racocetra fulgida]
MTKRCECLYLLKATLDNSKWHITEIVNKHNHNMAKDIQVFYEHCQLTRDARQIVVKMLKAVAKPNIVYDAVRNDDETPTATKKDISNLSARIHSFEEAASMGALIIEESSLQNKSESIGNDPLLMYNDKEQLTLLLEKQKSILLERLNEIFAVSVINFSEIKVPEKIQKFQLSFRIPVNDIDQIFNPKSDDNCGFQSLVVAIKRNEENWILVKLAMNGQLTKCIKIYKN